MDEYEVVDDRLETYSIMIRVMVYCAQVNGMMELTVMYSRSDLLVCLTHAEANYSERAPFLNCRSDR
ncbi:MAG: hypothetical protein U5K71_12940 [Gracilimonas sp.]|nr:hypothetical protein [Gracilimonas sp.]